jgi:hypothetical protein
MGSSRSEYIETIKLYKIGYSYEHGYYLDCIHPIYGRTIIWRDLKVYISSGPPEGFINGEIFHPLELPGISENLFLMDDRVVLYLFDMNSDPKRVYLTKKGKWILI